MKWLLIIVGGVLALGLIAYIAMAVQSQKRPGTWRHADSTASRHMGAPETDHRRTGWRD